MGERGASGLTPRQREWLGHLQACLRGGETLRGYARRHRLSEHAMYQAAKLLRRRGVLAGGVGRREAAKARPAFVRVVREVSPAPTAAAAWRARLPNGVVLEGSGGLEAALLEALARL
jgi:hypothetical protein